MKKKIIPLLCGIVGCLCYGGGDWLMLWHWHGLMSESMVIWFVFMLLFDRKSV